MSIENNKAVVARWFAEFWGPDHNPGVIDELAAPDIRFEYSMHGRYAAASRCASSRERSGPRSPTSASRGPLT